MRHRCRGAVMDYLYSTGRKRVDPRYCRTHACIAQLFAASPSSDFNAAAWAYVAQAWNELAYFKEMTPGKPAADGWRLFDVGGAAPRGTFGRLTLRQRAIAAAEIDQRRARPVVRQEAQHPADQNRVVAGVLHALAGAFEHRQESASAGGPSSVGTSAIPSRLCSPAPASLADTALCPAGQNGNGEAWRPGEIAG